HHWWRSAIVACDRRSVIGRPTQALRHATALFYNGELDGALQTAELLFDSDEDAAARPIARSVYLRQRDYATARSLLRRALDEHLQRGDHADAARDAHELTGALTREALFVEALEVAELYVRQADLTSDARLQGNARLTLGKLFVDIGDDA